MRDGKQKIWIDESIVCQAADQILATFLIASKRGRL